MHLTSSTGVRMRLVKAPEKPPVNQRADKESSESRGAKPDEYKRLRPMRSKKKRDEFSRAAPTSGAEMPRYRPRKPSARMDWRKQSRGPVYRRGRWSGWDCRRTLTVSKGYSMYLPTIPAAYT